MAAAHMHAGEGADDAVPGSEVQETGKGDTLGQRRRRHESQPGHHAGAQPSHCVAARAHTLAQKWQ